MQVLLIGSFQDPIKHNVANVTCLTETLLCCIFNQSVMTLVPLLAILTLNKLFPKTHGILSSV